MNEKEFEEKLKSYLKDNLVVEVIKGRGTHNSRFTHIIIKLDDECISEPWLDE